MSGSGRTAIIQPSRVTDGAVVPDHAVKAFVMTARACPRCSGMGYVYIGEDTYDCPVCKGRGLMDG